MCVWADYSIRPPQVPTGSLTSLLTLDHKQSPVGFLDNVSWLCDVGISRSKIRSKSLPRAHGQSSVYKMWQSADSLKIQLDTLER
ncbi:17757_t:CDS:2 [Racocetra persica]|uniref:17757_t:CDS:1 n=1 Tax=Racocetra persica TaxID=160502 RepID=A0ACA9KJY4_9GLOM|nr:17757_t:CDS:2 [Racocetra persica]